MDKKQIDIMEAKILIAEQELNQMQKAEEVKKAAKDGIVMTVSRKGIHSISRENYDDNEQNKKLKRLVR